MVEPARRTVACPKGGSTLEGLAMFATKQMLVKVFLLR